MLKNVSRGDVCFKIKTTAPRRYCVRPNCGVIEADGEQKISVLLQPFQFDAQDKNKHKFMVQCMALSPGEREQHNSNVEGLFKETEKSSPDRISDTKLKCTFIPTEGEAGGAQAEPVPQVPVVSQDLSNVQKLETELSNLRHDNIKIQEDNERLQRELNTLKSRPAPSAPATAVAHKSSGMSPIMVLVVALVAILLGVAGGIFLAPTGQ